MAITTTTINRAVHQIGESRSAVNGQSANASGGEILVVDPGAGYKIAIEYIAINCSVAESVSIREDSTVVLGPIAFPATGGHVWEHQFMKDDEEGSLLLAANKELQVLTAGSNPVQVYVEYHILKEA